MTWEKGQSGNPEGRKPGVPNKITTAFRSAVLGAFHENGGQEWLAKWARRHPTQFFQIAARLIPLELVGADGGPIRISPEHLSPEEKLEIARRMAYVLHSTNEALKKGAVLSLVKTPKANDLTAHEPCAPVTEDPGKVPSVALGSISADEPLKDGQGDTRQCKPD